MRYEEYSLIIDDLKSQMNQDIERIQTILTSNPDLKVTIQYINQKSDNKVINSRSIFTLVFIALFILILQNLTSEFRIFNVILTNNFNNVIQYILIAILIISLLFIVLSEKNKMIFNSIGYQVQFPDEIDLTLFTEIVQVFENTLNLLVKRDEFSGEILRVEKKLFDKSFFLILFGPGMIVDQVINIHANLISGLSDQFQFVAEINEN